MKHKNELFAYEHMIRTQNNQNFLEAFYEQPNAALNLMLEPLDSAWEWKAFFEDRESKLGSQEKYIDKIKADFLKRLEFINSFSEKNISSDALIKEQRKVSLFGLFVLVHQESTSDAMKCSEPIRKRVYEATAYRLLERFNLPKVPYEFSECFYKKLRDGIVHNIEYKTDLKNEQDILVLDFTDIKTTQKDLCQVCDLYQTFSQDKIVLEEHKPRNIPKDRKYEIEIKNFVISYSDYQFICECFINAYVNEYLNKR